MVFNSSTDKPQKILPDELEKKIELVNKYLTQAQARSNSINLEIESTKQELYDEQKKLDVAKQIVDELSTKRANLVQSNSDLNQETADGKKDLAKITEDIARFVVERNTLQTDSKSQREALIQKEKDLLNQEKAINFKARALAEKEVKVDRYAVQVKKILDALK